MIPTKKRRKRPQRTETLIAAEKKATEEYAVKLREIGDELDLQQKIVNLLKKLFRPQS